MLRRRTILALLAVLPLPSGPSGRAGDAPPAAADAFPASWKGTWRGPARGTPRKGPIQTFSMELRVEPREDGTWTWTIVYGEGERAQVRPYVLVPVEGDAGHWRIDERNGIVIDAYGLEDALLSRFDVAGNRIDVQYRMREGGIDVTLTTYAAKPVTESGGEGGIPAVAAHELLSVQRARLSRVQEGR